MTRSQSFFFHFSLSLSPLTLRFSSLSRLCFASSPCFHPSIFKFFFLNDNHTLPNGLPKIIGIKIFGEFGVDVDHVDVASFCVADNGFVIIG